LGGVSTELDDADDAIAVGEDDQIGRGRGKRTRRMRTRGSFLLRYSRAAAGELLVFGDLGRVLYMVT